MASIADLVRAVAEVSRLEENFVSVYARSAREAGLITHRGRGRSAAQMSATDATNLLIALNAGTLAKDAPEVIPRYRDLFLRWLDPAKLHESPRLRGSSLREVIQPGIRFGPALDRLVAAFTPDTTGERDAEAMFVDGTSYPQGGVTREQLLNNVFVNNRLELHFERPRRSATLSFRMGERYATREGLLIFLARYEDPGEVDVPETEFGDRVQRTIITTRTLAAIGRILAT